MSGFSNPSTERKIYANIVNGKFAVRAKSLNEDDNFGNKSVARESENPKTKEKKTVYEWLYGQLQGELKHVETKNSDGLGWQYVVTIGVPAAPDVVISIGYSTNYGRSLATKLPNLKKGEVYVFKPYNFDDKEKKDKKGNPKKNIGISISLDGTKDTAIGSYYHKTENGVTTTINGYPTVSREEAATYETEDWEDFGRKIDKFLRTKVSEWALNQEAAASTTAPAKTETKVAKSTSKDEFLADLDTNPDDLPF